MADRKILLVNVNEHNQYAFRLFLEAEGYCIVNAQTEAETVNCLGNGDILATFIDISRAESDHEACTITKIRNIAPGMLLVLISSLPRPEITALPEKFNNLIVLEKPLSITEIRRILNDYIPI